MNARIIVPQILFVGFVAFFIWTALIPIVGFVHELGHALIVIIYNIQISEISLRHVATATFENYSALLVARLAGGLVQAFFSISIFIIFNHVRKNHIFLKKFNLGFLITISINLALLTHTIIGGINAIIEGFFPETYSIIFNDLNLLIIVSLSSALISSIILYATIVAPMKDEWVFGYGSVIWDRSGINFVEEKIGDLQGWHREWTWISERRRHGAPTCSLQPKGKVKGVFLRINPKTREMDLQTLRKREGHATEKIIESEQGIRGKIHFWTMGNNLNRYNDTKEGLNSVELYGALAKRAKSVTKRGPDGKTAEEYALKVHNFDPDDQITKRYVDEIKKISKNIETPSQVIKVVKTRIASLKANRNFFTVLFTIESAVLTIIFADLSHLLHMFGFSIVLLSISLIFMLFGIFALTDCIHFYSKYIEFRYAWDEMVHGVLYRNKSKEQKETKELQKALEADDLGYHCLKLSLLFFLFFLASFIFMLPPETVDVVSQKIIFTIISGVLIIASIMTYKCTHHKPLFKASKDFFKRKSIFKEIVVKGIEKSTED